MQTQSKNPSVKFPEFSRHMLLGDLEREALAQLITRYSSNEPTVLRISQARPAVVTTVADVNARLVGLDDLALEIEYAAMRPFRRTPPEPLL